MSLPLEREQIRLLTEELELIIAAHLAWFKQINRALVCGSEPSRSDLAADAHLRTPFAQWYYSGEPHALSEHAVFRELGTVQQAMHAASRQALREVADGRRPTPDLYDQCIDLSLRLNTRLRTLQLEIIGELMSTDPLTGCSTRRGMLARLREEQERALRSRRPCCICLMDFDHFKRINDELGHPAGDSVLQQGMKFVIGVLRKYDSLYRYGGEEFLICLPGTPIENAVQVVDRLREGLSALPIRLPDNRTVHVTASFGLAEMHPHQAVEETIANADLALLRSKENGRNRVEVWEGEGPGAGDEGG